MKPSRLNYTELGWMANETLESLTEQAASISNYLEEKDQKGKSSEYDKLLEKRLKEIETFMEKLEYGLEAGFEVG